jgi:hypothetical protein
MLTVDWRAYVLYVILLFLSFALLVALENLFLCIFFSVSLLARAVRRSSSPKGLSFDRGDVWRPSTPCRPSVADYRRLRTRTPLPCMMILMIDACWLLRAGCWLLVDSPYLKIRSACHHAEVGCLGLPFSFPFSFSFSIVIILHRVSIFNTAAAAISLPVYFLLLLLLPKSVHCHRPPNILIEEYPPGGATTFVVGRSVMKFPVFWLPLLAHMFEERPS